MLLPEGHRTENWLSCTCLRCARSRLICLSLVGRLARAGMTRVGECILLSRGPLFGIPATRISSRRAIMPTGMGIGFCSWRLSEGAAAHAQTSRPIEAVKSLDLTTPRSGLPVWAHGNERGRAVCNWPAFQGHRRPCRRARLWFQLSVRGLDFKILDDARAIARLDSFLTACLKVFNP